ncbi:hypothetical protein KIL84_022035, partial [Mauremys mutica]
MRRLDTRRRDRTLLGTQGCLGFGPAFVMLRGMRWAHVRLSPRPVVWSITQRKALTQGGLGSAHELLSHPWDGSEWVGPKEHLSPHMQAQLLWIVPESVGWRGGCTTCIEARQTRGFPTAPPELRDLQVTLLAAVSSRPWATAGQNCAPYYIHQRVRRPSYQVLSSGQRVGAGKRDSPWDPHLSVSVSPNTNNLHHDTCLEGGSL